MQTLFRSEKWREITCCAANVENESLDLLVFCVCNRGAENGRIYKFLGGGNFPSISLILSRLTPKWAIKNIGALFHF